MTQATEVQMNEILSELTDAIIHDMGDVDAVMGRYPVDHSAADELMPLIQRLHVNLQPVEPSARFSRQLRSELQGAPQRSGLLARLRRLPARVQMAAGLALVAGALLVIVQRIVGNGGQHKVEEATAV